MPLDAAPPRVRPRTNAPAREMEVAEPTPEGYWFDEAAARAACDFFPRHLKFTKDKWAGRPFRLEPWQADDIARPLFGWKRANGTRRYRRCILFVPRKNGKTEFASGVGIIATIGDGLKGAETYFLASTEAQARIMYDKASSMILADNALARNCAITGPSIYWSEYNSFIKPLDGKARGKHGLNASALVADEVHEWRTGDLYSTVHQSEAARSQPIELIVSTAGVRGRGYGWEVWQEALGILEGTFDDPETLVVIYAADPDDDWTRPETWAKANPNLGVSVQYDYIAAECRKAMSRPWLENEFRRYHLNQWAGQTTRWLQLRKWDECKKSDWRDESDLLNGPKKRECFAGVDLAQTNDFTAVALIFPPDPASGSKVWRRLYRYFYPEGRVEERVRQTGLPLQRWIEAGAIITTPGNSVDYDFVAAALIADAERFRILHLGVDSWNEKHFSNALERLGFPIELVSKVGQGYRSLSDPSKIYENMVVDGYVDHGGHPVTRWMADNVMIRRDSAANIKPDKGESSEKIDGIVADIIAQFVAANAPVTEGVGVIS